MYKGQCQNGYHENMDPLGIHKFEEFILRKFHRECMA